MTQRILLASIRYRAMLLVSNLKLISECQNAEFEKLAAETDDQLQKLREQWFGVILESTDLDDYQNKFRTGLLKLAFSYNRLVVLSYGFQHAFRKNNTDENPFLQRVSNLSFVGYSTYLSLY